MTNKISIFISPNSITENSVAVLWDEFCDNNDYNIYVNNILHGKTKSNDYTIENLESDTRYEIFVSVDHIKSNIIEISTKKECKVFNVNDYGAVGDGITLNTYAIQKTIDTCSVFGKVYIPKGVYISGAIYLKSDMTLYMEEGAVLLGSDNPDDYPIKTYRWEGKEQACYSSLVNTRFDVDSIKNLTICGKGKIDGNGSQLITKELAQNKGQRGRTVCIRNCDGLYIKDITVKHSPAWCLHLIYSKNITVNNIKIYTLYDEEGNYYKDIYNGDGLDPDSCNNVYIFNSYINSQDDCIAIKSGRDEEGRKVGISSENIRISNCRFENGFGVAIGSEMSGSVRNVRIFDCDFKNSYSVCSIKAPKGRGGIVEDIEYNNITHKNISLSHFDTEWFRGALYIDNFYSVKSFNPNEKEEFNDGTPVFRNITLKNITCETIVSTAIYICGLPEQHLSNITLENINAKGKWGMKIWNVDNIVLKNVNVEIIDEL